MKKIDRINKINMFNSFMLLESRREAVTGMVKNIRGIQIGIQGNGRRRLRGFLNLDFI